MKLLAILGIAIISIAFGIWVGYGLTWQFWLGFGVFFIVVLLAIQVAAFPNPDE